EMMGGEPAGYGVEAGIGEWKILAARSRVGLHAGRGIDGDDDCAGLAQAPCDMTAARCDVEDRDAGPGLAPLDHEIEIRTGCMDIGKRRVGKECRSRWSAER